MALSCPVCCKFLIYMVDNTNMSFNWCEFVQYHTVFRQPTMEKGNASTNTNVKLDLHPKYHTVFRLVVMCRNLCYIIWLKSKNKIICVTYISTQLQKKYTNNQCFLLLLKEKLKSQYIASLLYIISNLMFSLKTTSRAIKFLELDYLHIKHKQKKNSVAILP